jgi:hypothetical protein
MTTAGFGPLATPPDTLDGPWEHVPENGRIQPIPPDPSQRFQARSAVGRNAHASIVDLGRFAALHLRGARGESDFLKAETFRRLHTPVPPSNYALGWGRDRAGWHKGLSLAHGGSNGQNQCLITIIPDENYAICVMTNIGGADASALCNRVTKDLARELKQRRPSRASDDGKG